MQRFHRATTGADDNLHRQVGKGGKTGAEEGGIIVVDCSQRDIDDRVFAKLLKRKVSHAGARTNRWANEAIALAVGIPIDLERTRQKDDIERGFVHEDVSNGKRCNGVARTKLLAIITEKLYLLRCNLVRLEESLSAGITDKGDTRCYFC